MSRRLVWTMLNLKGGTTKTTSAVFLAHALAELGRSVLVVDADPQGGVLSWNEDAPEPFPFPVVGLPTKTLHRQLDDVTGDRFDAVVIDTPPIEEREGIVMSALRVATTAICPLAPTPPEYRRLAAVRAFASGAADYRRDEREVPLAVLFTRTIPNALSTSAWRDQVVADGLWVLKASVGRLERFSQADGDNITNAARTAYGDAAREIIDQGEL